MLLSQSQIKEKQAAELMRLIEYVGGQSVLAAQLNVSRQVVSAWVNRGRISATAATEVERLSKGLFLRKDLRPDVSNWREDV